MLGNGPRQELSTVALNNEIYIFGGIPLPDAAGAIPTLDTVEVYSLTGKKWRNSTALPIPMNHANGKCNLHNISYQMIDTYIFIQCQFILDTFRVQFEIKLTLKF